MGANRQVPAVASRWKHYNGIEYTVEHIANVGSLFTEHPETVVYRGDNGRVWARPLSDWYRSMTPIQEEIADAAKRIFGISVQALAGEIVEAVRKDELDGGCDISAGMFGPNFSNLIRRIVAEYLRKPVPGFDMLTHLQRQREFSERTFGPGPRTAGLIDHIRKELREIEADPGDLAEWIDVAILALDGAWRTGASPQQIIDALVAKQVKNEGRTWPDWRTAPPDKAIGMTGAGRWTVDKAFQEWADKQGLSESEKGVAAAAWNAANERIQAFVGFVAAAPFSSGVCCCGESMGLHSDPWYCGHAVRCRLPPLPRGLRPAGPRRGQRAAGGRAARRGRHAVPGGPPRGVPGLHAGLRRGRHFQDRGEPWAI